MVTPKVVRGWMGEKMCWACLLVGALVLFGGGAAHTSVWYVDIENSSGIEDGTSWATAFTTIQPPISVVPEHKAVGLIGKRPYRLPRLGHGANSKLGRIL